MFKKRHKSKSDSTLLQKQDSFVDMPYPYCTINIREAFAESLKNTPITEILKLEKTLKKMVFVGENWLNGKDKPIAVLWGFNDWKLGFVSDYLSEYRTVFAKRKFLNADIFNALLSFPEKINVFIVWGSTDTLWVKSASKLLKVPIIRMEDGFLRSFRSNELHSTPFSIVLDKKGIYYNAKYDSEIETILNQTDNSNLLHKAEAGLALMRSAKLTKYYNLVDQDTPAPFERRERYSILVVGQVEDDASIHYGMIKKLSNNNMVKIVRELHPTADIYYRPHPDVIYNNRKSSNPIYVEDICTILDPKIPLYDALSCVDHVYTMTSLVGMEALILGKKVTVFGAPFYSGWSLTENINTTSKNLNNRRSKKLSLPELFAGVYLTYPLYFHPVSSQKIDFLELASYFLVEKVKFKNLFNIPLRIADLNLLKPYKEFFSIPLKILYAIVEASDHGMLKSETLFKIVDNNFKLHDFPQVAHLLIHSSNFDVLQKYTNYCLDFLDTFPNEIYNTRLLENFFSHLAYVLKNTNGRTLRLIANLMPYISEHQLVKKRFWRKFIVDYTKCLSRNIQYDILEKLIAEICNNARETFVYLPQIVNILLQNPTRSERNFFKRNILLHKVAACYHEQLHQQYPSHYDVFLNMALYNVMIDNQEGVLDAYNNHLALFKENSFSFYDPEFNSWGELHKRSGHFQLVYSYLLKHGHFSYAECMLRSFVSRENSKKTTFTNNIWLTYFLATSNYNEFIREFISLPLQEQTIEKNLIGYAKALRCLGEFEKAKQTLFLLIDKHNISVEKKAALQDQIKKIDFCISSGQILNSFPQPKVPKGVVFLASQTCYNTMAMLVPVLIEVKRLGYAVINLTEGMLPSDKTGIKYIDQFENILPANLYRDKLEDSWEVDWGNKKIAAGGINFYQGFYEGLSVSFRSYFVNLNIPQINNKFIIQLKRSDTVLSICRKIFEELVERGIPVAFVSGNTHVTPFSVMRDYCRHKSHPLLSFINANVAYENYFSNLGSKFSNTMSVTDMTLYPNIRAPFLARRDQFEPWYKKNKANSKYLEQAGKLINVNRNSSTDNVTELKLIEYFKEQKAQGKKIYCIFGKIPVDLNVPYDGGSAHESMQDWLNHTVKVCGETNDVILLVKPHPHELRPEIALDIQEGFIDLINEEVKSNVKLLGHKDINIYALAPFLDLAILWNGSSGLELTVQGVPVIMCAYFGKHDYPVNLIYPESRGQYETLLKTGVFSKPDAELQKKAAFLICYMGTEEITIINQYSFRQITNDKVGIPRWRKDKIKELLENGDPHMKRAATRIVEKLEGISQKKYEKELTAMTVCEQPKYTSQNNELSPKVKNKNILCREVAIET